MVRLHGALFLATACVLALSACSKDADLNDEQQKQHDDAVRALQPVVGDYTGVLKDSKGNVLGALEVTVDIIENPAASSTTYKGSTQPAPEVTLHFIGSGDMTGVTSTSHVSSQSKLEVPMKSQATYGAGQLQAEDDISTTTPVSGTTVTSSARALKLLASPSDQGLTGTLYEQGYDKQFAATFSLQRNGTAIENIAKESIMSTTSPSFTSVSYGGSAVFSNGTLTHGGSVSKNVALIMESVEPSDDAALLFVISPIKAINATVNFGDGAQFTFSNYIWNQATGNVTGAPVVVTYNTATITQQSTLKLQCNGTTSTSASCLLISGDGAGSNAKLNLSVSTSGLTVPPDDNTNQQVIGHFTGTGTFPDIGGKSVQRTVQLEVIYNARTRGQDIQNLLFPAAEQIVTANLTMDNGAVGNGFPNTVWDTRSRTLSTPTPSSVTAGGTVVNGALSLSCSDFDLQTTNYNFTCQYQSTLNGSDVTLTFNSQQ